MTHAPSANQSQCTLKRLTLLMVLASLFTVPVLAQVIGDLNVEGDIKAGTTTLSATVKVFKSGSTSEVVDIGSDLDGGSILIDDNTNALAMYIAAAVGTTGGYLDLLGSTGGAFFVDGDGGASGEPFVLITGTSTTVFDTNVTGDASVELPVDAVNAAEILNETGGTQSVDIGFVTLSGGPEIVEASMITAPTVGFVLAIGSGQLDAITHTTGTLTHVDVGVSDDCDASPTLDADQMNNFLVPASAPTTAGYPDTYAVPFSAQKIFPVAAGAATFCLIADEVSGDVGVSRESLSLLFFPTAYGAVDQTRPGPAGAAGDAYTDGAQGGLTASEIAVEQARAAAANQTRIDRELAEMQARMEVLEAGLREMRQQKGYGDTSGGNR